VASKPKNQTIIMVKVDSLGGLDTYAPLDKMAADTLGGRNSFEASIPVRGRSLSQNALWAVWYKVIADQVGEDIRQVKRQCKLTYGVPIMCAWDDGFRAIWDAKFANDTEIQQLYMMKYLPVTSLMNKTQGNLYTETLQREFAEQNVILEVL